MSAPTTSDCNQDATRAHGSSLQRLVSRRSYYEDAFVTLYHGDARELVPELLDYATHTIVTDPPYGMLASAIGIVAGDSDKPWDVRVPAAEWMKTKCAVVTASEPFATELINTAPIPFRLDCVWVKNLITGKQNANRMPLRRHERVLVFGDYEWNPQRAQRTPEEMSRLNQEQRAKYLWRYPESVLEFECVNARSSERVSHPFQKPVPLMEYLIKSFTAGIVCDPFAGSGSTLVAAKRIGRHVIGFEREEQFCELAAMRCGQELALCEAANHVIPEQ